MEQPNSRRQENRTMIRNYKRQLRWLITFNIVLWPFLYYTFLSNGVRMPIQPRIDDERCSTDDVILNRRRHPVSALEVDAPCPLKDRIRLLNLAIDRFRSKIFQLKKKETQWKDIRRSRHTKVVRNLDPDFFQRLAQFSQVKILALPWIRSPRLSERRSTAHDNSNLLLRHYYDWTGDEVLCNSIENKGLLQLRYDQIFNHTCRRNITNGLQATSLSNIALNLRTIKTFIYRNNPYPDALSRQPPDHTVYMFIIRNGFVTPNNEIFTERLKLVLCGCRCEEHVKSKIPQNASSSPLYDEVMPISQYWGDKIFHRMIEDIPRLVLFIDFLKNNPQVKILSADTGGLTAEFLRILGLDESRLITGSCRARVIYMPRETLCCSVNVPEIQVSSELYGNYITANFPTEPRNVVILIRRTGKERRFSQMEAIETMVEAEVKKYNLRFTVFRDNPAPSLNDTMKLFRSAVLVIAPHGAGLSNLIFSQPGTFVVEAVCNPPKTALCFQSLSHSLGHRWHGIMSKAGCPKVVDVEPSRIREAVRHYLDAIARLSDAKPEA